MSYQAESSQHKIINRKIKPSLFSTWCSSIACKANDDITTWEYIQSYEHGYYVFSLSIFLAPKKP